MCAGACCRAIATCGDVLQSRASCGIVCRTKHVEDRRLSIEGQPAEPTGSRGGASCVDCLGGSPSLAPSLVPSAGLAQQAPDLRKPAGKEWLTIGGDWGNTRYSTLTQINRNNVKNLKGAWVVHLGSGLGAEVFAGRHADRQGRRHVYRDRQRRRLRARRQDRRADLGAPLRHRPEHQHGLLRLGQSRRRGRRGQGVPRPARRQLRRARRQDRQAGLEDAGRRAGRTATPSRRRRSTTTA